jgi:hypothetical protein
MHRYEGKYQKQRNFWGEGGWNLTPCKKRGITTV